MKNYKVKSYLELKQSNGNYLGSELIRNDLAVTTDKILEKEDKKRLVELNKFYMRHLREYN